MPHRSGWREPIVRVKRRRSPANKGLTLNKGHEPALKSSPAPDQRPACLPLSSRLIVLIRERTSELNPKLAAPHVPPHKCPTDLRVADEHRRPQIPAPRNQGTVHLGTSI